MADNRQLTTDNSSSRPPSIPPLQGGKLSALNTGWAFGWQIWCRHRFRLVACLAYVTALAIGQSVLADYLSVGARIGPCFPLVGVACYLLIVFGYAAEGDVAAAESCFPNRMFTLPVSTAALAGWPMFCGTAALGLLWVIAARFVLRPLGAQAPLVWPALLLMCTAAWMQVLLWSTFPLRWLRPIVAIIVLSPLAIVPQVVFLLPRHAHLVSPALAALGGLAYLIAVVRLRRARCGRQYSWHWPAARLPAVAKPRGRKPFGSPLSAQVWFEWRRHGLALPFGVTCIMPFFVVSMLVSAGTTGVQFLIGVALGTPLLMAGFVGTSVSKTDPWAKDYYGISPFTATKPITSAAIVFAKLKMAAFSSLAAWALTLAILSLGLLPAANRQMVDNALAVLAPTGGLQQAAAAILIVVLLWGITWKRIVQNLYIGLTGREWIIKGSIVLDMIGWACLYVLSLRLGWHPEDRVRFIEILPWAAGILLAVKLAIAIWASRLLVARRLLSLRFVSCFFACWLGVSSLLAAFVVLLIPMTRPEWLLAAIAVALLVPLARLTLGPLAVTMNRHR